MRLNQVVHWNEPTVGVPLFMLGPVSLAPFHAVGMGLEGPYIATVLAALAGIPRARADLLTAFFAKMDFACDRVVLCNQLGHRAISLVGDLGLWNRSAPEVRPLRIIGRWLQ